MKSAQDDERKELQTLRGQITMLQSKLGGDKHTINERGTYEHPGAAVQSQPNVFLDNYAKY